MQMLSGKFVQVGPDGRRTQGEFYISKPGKVRFEYDDPSPIELIADGQSVVVRDRRLATQDVYPLSQTPLRFLLADHVDLMKDTSLVAVYADDVFVTVVVEEKNGVVGTSRLMIMFSAKDMQLKQWTVTDPQGYDTTVAVYNLDTSKRPDPGMFKIDYTQLSQLALSARPQSVILRCAPVARLEAMTAGPVMPSRLASLALQDADAGTSPRMTVANADAVAN